MQLSMFDAEPQLAPAPVAPATNVDQKPAKPHLNRANAEFDREQDFSWDDRELSFVFDGMLQSTLRQIRDSNLGSPLLDECLQWVFSDDEEYANPLSFVNCCNAVGHDPVDQRGLLLSTLKNYDAEKFVYVEQWLEDPFNAV